MKIIRIIARLNVGGPAQHVTWLSAGLQRRKHETVLVTGNVSPGEDEMTSFVAAQGVRPVVLPEMSRELSPWDVVTIWKLWRLLRRERPDVVHTHTAKAGAVGRVATFLYRYIRPEALFGRTARCVVVHTYHGHVFHGYYGALKTKVFLAIERTLARLMTDRIVVLSRQQLEEIQSDFGVGRREQFAIVPLGLDLSRFEDIEQHRSTFRDEMGVAKDEFLIGIVGRLTEIKNHDLLFRAVARLVEQRRNSPPRVVIAVIGSGHLRERLEAQTAELGISAFVRFAGFRTDPEVFLAGLDLVVLTSRNEGTPLSIIEAMAAGRPVLSTAVGGVGDILGASPSGGPPAAGHYDVAERGVIVPSEDIEALVSGLERLVEDGALRQSLALKRPRPHENPFSLERLLNDVERLYEETLSVRR